jgi:methionyl-tRNA synthetase
VTPSHYQSVLETELQSSNPPSDLSISRPASRLTWGIPVPSDPSHTIYVWVDALINYITVLGYPSPSSSSSDWSFGSDTTALGWPADVQIVGKDIVRFHALYWPAMLMAVGLQPPKQVLVHAHWLQGNLKMSKSRGNVADPFEAIERCGVDSVRAYLMGVGGALKSDSGQFARPLLTRVLRDV